MSEAINSKQLHKDGNDAYARGDYLNAARLFDAAAQGCESVGDRLAAAEMHNNASVAYLQAGDAEAAFHAVEGTPGVFEAAGDLKRQGLAVGNFGAALEGLNRNEEALDAYQQSADILKLAGDTQARAQVMQSLSALQLKTGRQLQALATMQSGLDGVERPSVKQRLLRKLLDVPFQFLNRS